ncbi:MAG: hypothetical protein KKF20_02415 [Bacteroidetes bacterium]|nr:hypothetical protein [Bacteroidota bacterium]MBU1421695.1 hypothetical protein [Bacteroidota bacterium]MBU2471244.1 hypothetical protein [Bacteroidota bacterium]
METAIIEQEPVIFTTGAFLKPVMTTLNGKNVWMWTVTEFIDDSYKDGITYNPNEFAESREKLLEEIT